MKSLACFLIICGSRLLLFISLFKPYRAYVRLLHAMKSFFSPQQNLYSCSQLIVLFMYFSLYVATAFNLQLNAA
nr:hypothetical protein Q903MT_gene1081 [Picea sitchensis]